MNDHVPVITGNCLPFRLVLREGHDVWEPSIEQINNRAYDYVKLHRASTFLDVGIRPLSMAVCFDGTLALPAIKQYRDPECALATFNRTLCEALVGGVYSEAMSPDDICLGRMTYTAYCKIIGAGRGAVSKFHKAIRTRCVGPLDAILLLDPETITDTELQTAVAIGRKRLRLMGPTTPETLLYGTTFFARNQWAESLIHLWTSIEQIIDAMWQEKMISESSVSGISKKARGAFLKDYRTWTASTKLEVLYQKELLPDTTYTLLNAARKARNSFAHYGTLPSREETEAALDGLLQIGSLRVTSYGDACELDSVAELVKARSQVHADWERRGEPIEGVTHWLDIPPVPGDKAWGDRPFEIIEELTLKPLERDGA